MAAPRHESNGIVNGVETHDASFAFGTTVPVPPNIDQSPDYQAKKPANAETGFKLGNFSIDDLRPMRVAIIGAGFSGECIAYSLFHCSCPLTLGITAGIRYVSPSDSLRARTDTHLDFCRRFRSLSLPSMSVTLVLVEHGMLTGTRYALPFFLMNLEYSRAALKGLACDIPAHAVRLIDSAYPLALRYDCSIS
jgi:hypothetical protein